MTIYIVNIKCKIIMILTISRTFKEALTNFFRNSWLTVASVSVLIMSLFVVSVIYVLTLTVNGILMNIQEKVNVSVYFKSDTEETVILSAQKELQNLSEVGSVNYISRDQALENFKRDNAEEPVILQSLEEIGENPLLSSLVIKAKNPEDYQIIMDYVNLAQFKNEISRVNYGKHRETIDNLNQSVANIRKTGISLSIVFIFISILITFNTIRITIFTHKQEVEVMRLVGASNTFIRMHFIFEGFMYGIVASLISMILLYLYFKFGDITPIVSSIGLSSSKTMINVFMENIAFIFLMQLLLGISLGVISSLIAIRKFLKV